MAGQHTNTDKQLKFDFILICSNVIEVICCIVLLVGFQYGGVQFSYECWCGDKIRDKHKVSEERCDSSCAGNKTQFCGGYLLINVYHTGLGGIV